MTTPQTDALRLEMFEALAEWEAFPGTKTSNSLTRAARSCGYVGPWTQAANFAYRALLTSDREASQRREAVLREALKAVAQRLNESETGEMGLIDTIHAAHHLASAALNTGDAG